MGVGAVVGGWRLAQHSWREVAGGNANRAWDSGGGVCGVVGGLRGGSDGGGAAALGWTAVRPSSAITRPFKSSQINACFYMLSRVCFVDARHATHGRGVPVVVGLLLLLCVVCCVLFVVGYFELAKTLFVSSS